MPLKLLHTRVDEALERAVLTKAQQLQVTPSEAIRRALQAWVADENIPPETVTPDPLDPLPAEVLNRHSVLSRLWRRLGTG
jgi:antitoxin component of RelBE/YafQ-DinJ toxin-antitoxin module